MKSLSVSGLHLCQRCPRLMAYSYSPIGKNRAWRVGLSGSGNLPGSLFHEIAKKFHKDASGHGDNNKRLAFIAALSSTTGTIETRILEFFQIHYFLPFLQVHSEKRDLTVIQMDAVANGLRRWGKYLAGFLEPIIKPGEPVEDIVNKVFHKAEVLLKTTYRYQDKEKFEIRGKPDGLLFDPVNGEAIVLELKCREASDVPEDFAQTILYAWLVKNETGIVPRTEILYLEEEERIAKFSKLDVTQAMANLPLLLNVARNVIEKKKPLPSALNPNLCRQCTFDHTCDRYWGARSQSPPNPTLSIQAYPEKNPEPKSSMPLEKEQLEEHHPDKIMEKLVNTLCQFRLPVKPDGYIDGPRFIRLKVKPDISQNVTVNRIINKATDLQVQLGLLSPPLIQPQSGYVSIDIPKKVMEPVTLDMVLKQGKKDRPSSEATFPLGMGIDGEVLWADLAEPTMTSILIGGTSGSGKSELLRSIVISLALSSPPKSVIFTLIDPKRVTFTDFVNLPCLDGPVIMDADKAMSRLETLVNEMEARYKLLERSKVHDIATYNRTAQTPFARKVIVIDEYADLIINRDTKQSLETTVQRIGQKGRAAGFHLILATQRPDAKVITGVIKANLQLKISLKVTSAVNSRIILDEGGGEYLIGHGDMLVGGSIPLQRLQGLLVTKSDIDQLHRNYT